MKKKAAAILITAMALNLVACSSSNTSNTTTAGQDTAAAENADKQLRKGTARRQRERDLRLHFLCTKTPIHLPHISVLD